MSGTHTTIIIGRSGIVVAGVGVRASVAIEVAGTILDGCVRVVVASRWLGAPCACQVLTRPIIIGRSGIVVAGVGVRASVAIEVAGTILDGCVRVVVASRWLGAPCACQVLTRSIIIGRSGIVVAGVGVRASVAIEVAGTILDGCVRVVVASRWLGAPCACQVLTRSIIIGRSGIVVAGVGVRASVAIEVAGTILDGCVRVVVASRWLGAPCACQVLTRSIIIGRSGIVVAGVGVRASVAIEVAGTILDGCVRVVVASRWLGAPCACQVLTRPIIIGRSGIVVAGVGVRASVAIEVAGTILDGCVRVVVASRWLGAPCACQVLTRSIIIGRSGIVVAGVGVRASVAIEVAGTILDGCVRVVVASRWLGAPCACQVLTRSIIIGRSGIVVAGVGVRASVAIEVAGTILDGCVRVVVASRWLGAPCACQVLTRPIIIGRSGIVVAGVGVRASVAIEVAGTILDGCVRVVVASRWLGAPCACQVLTRPIIIGRSGIVVAGVGVRASVAIEVAGTILDGCVRVVVASRWLGAPCACQVLTRSIIIGRSGIVVAGVGVRASVELEVAGTFLDG